MKCLLRRMLDAAEFLSDHGIRALSKVHEKNPYQLDCGDDLHEVKYWPAEYHSQSAIEALRRREEIEQESKLHGAMDGAMKFVKGDAIAGMIIAFVNIIAGNWVRDVYRLKTAEGRQAVVRPPVPAGKYFQRGPYRGDRFQASWPEKLLAHWTTWRVRKR